MDRRNPDCRDANNPCHPWSLGSGDPCRNDDIFVNLMAVKLDLGNGQGSYFVLCDGDKVVAYYALASGSIS